MKKSFQSIGFKLLYTLVIATTLPMIIYCFFFSYDMRKSAEQTYIQNTRGTWQIVARNIDYSLSTSIDMANKGLYLNHTLQDLLFTRDSSTFQYAESANSRLLFSYMTNIYSMTPEATQIQLSTYKSGKSLLLTTRNLQKYIRNSSYDELETTPVPPFQACILPPHRQTSYGHQLNHLSVSQEEALIENDKTNNLVFTICLPIYHLPNPEAPVGQLLIDISLDYFDKTCGFLYDDTEQFYIVNADQNVMFASDHTLIGSQVTDPRISGLIEQVTKSPQEFISEKSADSLWICQVLPGSSYQWYIIKSIPKHSIYQTSDVQLTRMLLTFAICLLIVILINSGSILRYTNPLRKATIYLNSIKTQTKNLNSRLSDHVTYKSKDEIGILFRSLEEMMDTINNFVIRQYELEIINRTTELKMLEAQINPHFIYNTLQCLASKSLAHHDKEQYDYISSFGQLMQYSMDRLHTLVTLREELNHIRRYISLQRMRFTSQLTVSFEIDEVTEETIVPKMILQPLIENSFKHGNLIKQEHSTILIRAYYEEKLLHINVIDNGCPPSEEQLLCINQRLEDVRQEYIDKLLAPRLLSNDDETTGTSSGTEPEAASDIRNIQESVYAVNNIGVVNVLLRLLLNFGEDCSIELTGNELGGTTVHLSISYGTLWNKNRTVHPDA